MTTKQAVLQQTTLGSRIAEEEIGSLAQYFVETEQWRRVWEGDVDIVYGPKGSGKSAIYSTLVSRENELFDRDVLIAPAVNPRGAGSFDEVTSDPPTSELEFVGLWKVYFILLIAEKLDEYALYNEPMLQLSGLLGDVGLFNKGQRRKLKHMLKAAQTFVRGFFRVEEIEPQIQIHPTGGIAFSNRIAFREPTPEERSAGAVQVDELFELADAAFREAEFDLWLLLDRLDVAFEGDPELENNALRALFRVYLDLLPFGHIKLKIFLRTDIWRTITSGGFREASHITRDLTLEWDRSSLLRLTVQRLINNQAIRDYYELRPADVLSSGAKQQELIDTVYPLQVESGPNQSRTFDWCMRRTQDGTLQTAPRELIHLLTAARDSQLKLLELGSQPPPHENLFVAQALKEALPDVSNARLTRTMYAEFADLKKYMEALRGGKTNHNSVSLASIWNLDREPAREIADKLAEIGFFERRKNEGGETNYWVPFLYRPALDLVQGSADGVSLVLRNEE